MVKSTSIVEVLWIELFFVSINNSPLIDLVSPTASLGRFLLTSCSLILYLAMDSFVNKILSIPWFIFGMESSDFFTVSGIFS